MNRLEFLSAVKAVLPGVERGEPALPGADTIVFGDGLIRSYNDTLSVTYPADVGVTGCVRAVELVRVIEKMMGIELTITSSDNSISFTDGATTLTMKNVDADAGIGTLISALALESLEWIPLPPDFTDALTLCQMSVSRNPVHGALIGVRVDGNDVLSSDNFRATWVTLSSPMQPATIPGTSIKDLLAVGKLDSYAVTDSWAHFMSTEGAIFSTRVVRTEFPTDPLKRMFPSDDQTTTYTFPDAIDRAIERAAVLAYSQADGLDYITISFGDGYIEVRGERQCGSILERVPTDPTACPADLVFNIQPNYLIDVLKRTRKFSLTERLVYFHGDGFKHVIAPVVKAS